MVAALQCARQIRALSTLCTIGQFLATNFEGEAANDEAGFVPDSRVAPQIDAMMIARFAFLAESYQGYLETLDLVALSMRLANTPCSAIMHNSPARLVKDLLGANASRAIASAVLST